MSHDGVANLDNDGFSQLTYPNQFATSFMPKDQARRVEEDQQRNQNQPYQGIYFEPPTGPSHLSQQNSTHSGHLGGFDPQMGNPQYQ